MSKPLGLKEFLSEEKIEERIAEMSFEQGLKLLEELVARVESGGLALDTAVSSYERGVVLMDHLRKLLSGAEEKLKVLQKSGKS